MLLPAAFLSRALRLKRPTLVRDLIIAAALAGLTLAADLSVALRLRVMPAGDTFNFLTVARELKSFRYPEGEKRLPLYPLLILVGERFWSDPVAVATAISVMASAGTVVLFYLLARRFPFPILPVAALLVLMPAGILLSSLLTLSASVVLVLAARREGAHGTVLTTTG